MTEAEILTLKQTASEKTGVPVELISGETTKEISESALAMAAYKKKSYEESSAKDKFVAWMNGSVPVDYTPDPIPTPPAYPNVPDGGEPQNISEGSQDPRGAFTEWFADVSAFNPFKKNDIF